MNAKSFDMESTSDTCQSSMIGESLLANSYAGWLNCFPSDPALFPAPSSFHRAVCRKTVPPEASAHHHLSLNIE